MKAFDHRVRLGLVAAEISRAPRWMSDEIKIIASAAT